MRGEHLVAAECTQRAYLEPYAPGIASACNQLGMRAGVMVVIWLHGGRNADGDVTFSTPFLGYQERTVQRLAGMRLSLHHDQYVELPDP